MYKSGECTIVANYRCVVIICNFAKLFESIVAANWYAHVASCLSNSQHSFTQVKSTATNLCEFVQYVSDGMIVDKQIDIIYNDLSKAYSFNHSILLKNYLILEFVISY